MPWICDVLLSNHSVKAYGQDLMDFVRHMRALLDTGVLTTFVGNPPLSSGGLPGSSLVRVGSGRNNSVK